MCWRAWRVGSRLGRSSWRNIRRAAVGGGLRLSKSSFRTPSLQRVSKLLSGNSPPATIIANVDVLIGQCLRSPTIHLGCWNKNVFVLLFSCHLSAFDVVLCYDQTIERTVSYFLLHILELLRTMALFLVLILHLVCTSRSYQLERTRLGEAGLR